jgi:hypothetical protein
MVHTGFTSEVASTMERTRGHHRSGVRSPRSSLRSRRSALGARRSAGEAASLRPPRFDRREPASDSATERRAPSAQSRSEATDSHWMLPNRVLIRFRPDVSPETRQEMLSAAGARVKEQLAGGEVLIEFDATAAGSAAARRLGKSERVEACRRMMVIAAGYESQAEEAAAGLPPTSSRAGLPTPG